MSDAEMMYSMRGGAHCVAPALYVNWEGGTAVRHCRGTCSPMQKEKAMEYLGRCFDAAHQTSVLLRGRGNLIVDFETVA
jgi:hypothetical protein